VCCLQDSNTICFLALAPSIDCNAPSYTVLSALAFLTIVVYGVGFPALCATSSLNRSRLPVLHDAMTRFLDQKPLPLFDLLLHPGWSALLFYARKLVFAAVLGLLGSSSATATYLFLLLLFMLMFQVLDACEWPWRRLTTRACSSCF
jgi:hypothetical protein